MKDSELKNIIFDYDSETIKEIIKKNPEILKEKINGETLFVYIFRKYIVEREVIEFLLQYCNIIGTDLNRCLCILADSLKFSMRPDNFQKEQKLIEIIELFFKNGVDVNKDIENGNTILHILLHYECQYGYRYTRSLIKIIEILIEYGVDFNIKNKHGILPMESLIEIDIREKYRNLDEYESGEMKEILIKTIRLMLENGLNLKGLSPNYDIFKLLFQKRLEEKLQEKDEEIRRLEEENKKLLETTDNFNMIF